MNPGSSESHGNGFDLPPPQVEQMPGAGPNVNGNEQQPSAAEFSPSAPEQGNMQSQATAAVASSLVPPALTAQPAAGVANGTTNNASATTGDDGDLIDKAVVEKAKAIIAKTRNDPYRQTQEISGLRADFMQRTYNKTIKLEQ